MTKFFPGSQWSAALRFSPWIVCAVLLISWSQHRRNPATDEPNVSAAQQGPPSGGGADSKHTHGSFSGSRSREEDWKQAEAFFQAHAPHYLAKVEKLNLPENRLRLLHATMVSRVQTLQNLSEHFPELYDVHIRQLELFDALVATNDQYVAATGSEKERLSARMKQEVADLVANSLKERQTRITRIQDMLSKLQGTVERETRTQQQRVDNRFQRVLDHGVDASFMDNLVMDEVEPLPSEGDSYRGRPSTRPTHLPARDNLASPTTVPSSD